jgi:hypothetical protein
MKTVMEEVYENFNIMSDADFKAWMLNTDLLEKEKEQMIDFAVYWRHEDFTRKEITKYYNKTYGGNK